MDPTRLLLLKQMASTNDLSVFYLAYKALENLDRLVAQAQMVQGMQPQGMTPTGFQGPPQGPRNHPPSAPQFPSEPSWNEPSERMPWEEEL